MVCPTVLQAVQDLPQYKRLKAGLLVAHTYGEGNAASDSSSRGKFEELGIYCAQVGVRSRQVPIKPEVYDFVECIRNW